MSEVAPTTQRRNRLQEVYGTDVLHIDATVKRKAKSGLGSTEQRYWLEFDAVAR